MVLSTVADRSPLHRNTEPAEVADTAVFLASSLGRGLTGTSCLSTPVCILSGCSRYFTEYREK